MADTAKSGSGPNRSEQSGAVAAGGEEKRSSDTSLQSEVVAGHGGDASGVPFPGYPEGVRGRFLGSPFQMNKAMQRGSLGKLMKGDPPEPVPSELLLSRPSVCICLLRVRYETRKMATATGFLISPAVVATSAHVLHHPAPIFGRAEEVEVIPGYLQPEGRRHSQVVGRSALHCNENWGPPDNFVAEHDYGCIVLSDPVKFAACGHLVLRVPSKEDFKRDDLKVCGYPGVEAGEQLVQWRHIGELVDKPGQRTLLHNIKTKEGQSGSPVYFIDSKAKEVIVIGIHSKASTQKAGANVARMVTDDMIEDFTRWAVNSGASAPLVA